MCLLLSYSPEFIFKHMVVVKGSYCPPEIAICIALITHSALLKLWRIMPAWLLRQAADARSKVEILRLHQGHCARE